jgi:hypothetical protein
VRRFLPELIDLIWNRQIDPGKVFDLTLPLDQAAEGYRAMDDRQTIKTLLPRPCCSRTSWMSARRGRLAGMNEHIDVESGDVLVAAGTTIR